MSHLTLLGSEIKRTKSPSVSKIHIEFYHKWPVTDYKLLYILIEYYNNTQFVALEVRNFFIKSK